MAVYIYVPLDLKVRCCGIIHGFSMGCYTFII